MSLNFLDLVEPDHSEHPPTLYMHAHATRSFYYIPGVILTNIANLSILYINFDLVTTPNLVTRLFSKINYYAPHQIIAPLILY